jgi:type I restriction enzyme S subunit
MRKSDSLERLNAHGVTEMPDGWHVSKVKYLADYINGYPFKPDEWGAVGKPIIRIQNLTNRDAEPNRYDGEIGDSWAVKSGDFLIAWSASLGLHVWHGEPAWLNQHIFRVDLDESKCTRPFFRWLATWFMEEFSRGNSRGIQTIF